MGCCVYQHIGVSGEILYIGMANNFYRRTGDHERKASWFHMVKTVNVHHFPDRDAAMAAEKEMILRERPRFNSQYLTNSANPTKQRQELVNARRVPLMPLLKKALAINDEKILSKKVGVAFGVLSNFMNPDVTPAIKTVQRIEDFFKKEE